MDRGIILLALVVVTVAFSLAFRALSHRRHAIGTIDPEHLSEASQSGRRAVVFTSPYCHGCREWIDALGDEGQTPLVLDVVAHPELAARYRINSTPRVAVVDTADGTVLREWDHYTPRAHDVERVLALLPRR
ncbi:MAG: hypothetical protein HZB14_06525 [Actinobacteria bacterium]|nr:hypothetical protein [Actinomycetota bacterium]